MRHPSGKGPQGQTPSRPFQLSSFVHVVEQAQAHFPLGGTRVAIEKVGGRWFAYIPALHRSLGTHLSLNRPHLKVAATPEAMQADDELLAELGHARQAALELVALIDAEQEQVKGRMVERTGALIDVTQKRLSDPETPAEVARSLRNTFREPQAILESNQVAAQQKGRQTLSKNERQRSLAEENQRLRLEQKVLRGESLTLDDVAAVPAPKGRRRRPR